MEPKIVSKLIVKHSKECRSKHYCGSVCTGFFGNYAANENAINGRHHYWYKVRCNDPNCPGIKAVHSSVLEKA